MVKIDPNIHHLIKALHMLNFLQEFFIFLLHFEHSMHLKALAVNFFLKKAIFLFHVFLVHRFQNLIPCC